MTDDEFEGDAWGPERERWEREAAAELAEHSEPKTAPAITLGLGATPFVAGNGYARRFPLNALPAQMRTYVEGLAVRKQVPVDLPALTMIGILHTLAGPRYLVRRDWDWRQPLNGYVACAMASGAGKSPVVDELRRGVYKAMRVFEERHKEIVAAQIVALKEEGEALHRLANNPPDKTKPLAEQTAEYRSAAEAKESEAEELSKNPPAAPRLLFDGDMTVEALCAKLATTYGAGGIIDDEGTFLRVVGGLYNGGRAGNLGVLLVGFDARYYEPERISRETKPIKRAVLSMFLAPQPGILATAMGDQVMDEAGFINRFWICVPGDLAGQRDERPSTYYKDVPDERPDMAGKEWWENLLAGIVEAPIIGATEEHEWQINLDNAATFDLTRGAWKRHREYEAEFEKEIHPVTGNPKLKAWGSKHLARILRLAAILHIAGGGVVNDEIAEVTMEAAIEIGRWGVEHYLRAGSVIGLSEGAGRIAEYIHASHARAVTRSQIGKKVFANKTPKRVIDAFVAELVAVGGHEVVEQKTAGRPKTWVCEMGVTVPDRESDDD